MVGIKLGATVGSIDLCREKNESQLKCKTKRYLMKLNHTMQTYGLNVGISVLFGGIRASGAVLKENRSTRFNVSNIS